MLLGLALKFFTLCICDAGKRVMFERVEKRFGTKCKYVAIGDSEKEKKAAEMVCRHHSRWWWGLREPRSRSGDGFAEAYVDDRRNVFRLFAAVRWVGYGSIIASLRVTPVCGQADVSTQALFFLKKAARLTIISADFDTHRAQLDMKVREVNKLAQLKVLAGQITNKSI